MGRSIGHACNVCFILKICVMGSRAKTEKKKKKTTQQATANKFTPNQSVRCAVTECEWNVLFVKFISLDLKFEFESEFEYHCGNNVDSMTVRIFFLFQLCFSSFSAATVYCTRVRTCLCLYLRDRVAHMCRTFWKWKRLIYSEAKDCLEFLFIHNTRCE